jgi:hypothetical protein
MSTGIKYNNVDMSDILAIDTTNYNIMTNYTNNQNQIIFKKPFNTSTNKTNNTELIPTYKFFYAGVSFNFCPRYNFHHNTQNATAYGAVLKVLTSDNVSIPNASLLKKMLVVLVGGGGGGGGGAAEKDGGAGGGTGGGGGALGAYWVNYVAGVNSYSCSAGNGGNFGQPATPTNFGPGVMATNGANGHGKWGGDGSTSTFKYNGQFYSVNGGKGGGPGLSSDGGGYHKSSDGGAGGVGAGDYFNNGENGTTTYNNNGQSTPGGYGGRPGNLNTPWVGDPPLRIQGNAYLINPSLINMASSQSQISTRNIGTIRNLIYGEGGKGGMGDARGYNYGTAGEYGAPGCVIVFFYY